MENKKDEMNFSKSDIMNFKKYKSISLILLIIGTIFTMLLLLLLFIIPNDFNTSKDGSILLGFIPIFILLIVNFANLLCGYIIINPSIKKLQNILFVASMATDDLGGLSLSTTDVGDIPKNGTVSPHCYYIVLIFIAIFSSCFYHFGGIIGNLYFELLFYIFIIQYYFLLKTEYLSWKIFKYQNIEWKKWVKGPIILDLTLLIVSLIIFMISI